MKFLTKKLLLFFHEDQINKYGGSEGVLDENLLESALGQVQMSFGGEYLCKDVFDMAATYGYHLALDQPFLDGNKRVSLLAMYTFLFINGQKLICDAKELYSLIMAISQHKVDKADLIAFLRDNCDKID